MSKPAAKWLCMDSPRELEGEDSDFVMADNVGLPLPKVSIGCHPTKVIVHSIVHCEAGKEEGCQGAMMQEKSQMVLNL